MTDLNLRAARIQLFALIAALVAAILIAVGITTGSFVLSFAVLRDLGHQSGLPFDRAWILPAIIDGAIFGATIAAIALSKLQGNSKGKNFFVVLAVAIVCISVYMNAFHAYRAAQDLQRHAATSIGDTTPLAPTGSALIAIIPPLLILAFTHGVGLLIKAIGTAYTEYTALAHTTHDVAEPDEFYDDAERGVAYDSARTPAGGHTTDVDRAAGDTASALSFAQRIAPTPAPAQDATAVAAMGQTTEQLLDFIESTDLDPLVKETARIKITEPATTWGALANATHAKAPSTALRRYKKAVNAAVEAGFATPPLPVIEDVQEDHRDEFDFAPNQYGNGALINLRDRMVGTHL